MFTQTLSIMLVGVGLFFVGMKLLRENLMKLLSDNLQQAILRGSRSSLKASFFGFLLGIISQSAGDISLLTANLVYSRPLTVRASLPVVIWSNVGVSVLIFLSVLYLHVGIVFILCIAASFLLFQRHVRYYYLFGAVIGICLSLYGYHEFREELVKSIIPLEGQGYLFLLALGFILCYLLRAFAAIVILGIGLTQMGVWGVHQAMIFVYGVQLAYTLLICLESRKIKDLAQNLLNWHVKFKFCVLGILTLAFLLELYSTVPILSYFTKSFMALESLQLASFLVLVNTVAACIFTVVVVCLGKGLEGKREGGNIQCQHLSEAALGHPESALSLVEREHLAMMEHFPLYIESLREGRDSVEERPKFFKATEEVRHFLRNLADNDLSKEEAYHLLNLVDRQHLLLSLEESIYHACEALNDEIFEDKLLKLKEQFIDSLDTILLTALDSFQSFHETDISILLEISTDKQHIMEKIRKNYLDESQGLCFQEKSHLLHLTTLFERVVWILQKIALLLQRSTHEPWNVY